MNRMDLVHVSNAIRLQVGWQRSVDHDIQQYTEASVHFVRYGILKFLKFFLGAALCLCVAGIAHAQFGVIGKSDAQAPGMEDGVKFDRFYYTDSNAVGEVIFEARLTGTNVTSDNNESIWVGRPGSLQLVVREGDAAPGIGGAVTFKDFGYVLLSDKGEIAFTAHLKGNNVTVDNDEGIWIGRPGSLRLLAREGSSAPGLSGVFFGFSFSELELSATGHLAFLSTLTGSNVNVTNWTAVWMGAAQDDLSLVARKGDLAPGTSGHFTKLSSLAINNSGNLAFIGELEPTITPVPGGVTVQPHPGIWIYKNGNLSLVARDGETDRAGVLKFVDFVGRPALDGMGRVVFEARVKFGNNYERAIYAGSRGDLKNVAWTGETHRTPREFNWVSNPKVNDKGILAFTARRLNGQHLVYAGTRDNPVIVAAGGFPASGTESGVRFEFFQLLSVNNANEVAFTAQLMGSGVTNTNDYGAWVGSRDNIRLVVREGQSIEVAPSTSQEVLNFDPLLSQVGGRTLNEASQVAFKANLSGNTRTLILAPYGKPIVGQVTINHNWRKLHLPITYQNPIVIAGPPTAHSSDPGVIRLRNVTQREFEARFQEWGYLDGTHVLEKLSFLVLEKGRQSLPDGSTWEIGSFQLGGTGAWQNMSFTTPFASTPTLFLTIQTTNDKSPVTVRARNVSTTGFEAALFEAESLMDGHIVEEIGYLAIYSSNGFGTIDLGGFTTPYLLQLSMVDNNFTPVLSTAFRLEEEQSKDAEVIHVPETLSTLAVGTDVFSQIASHNGNDTVAVRRVAPEYIAPMEWGTITKIDHHWKTVPLAKWYSNPVVVAKPVSSNGGDAGVIRLRNVRNNAFDVRYQEWMYLDGAHPNMERVFYLVADTGKFTIAGLDVQAGKTTSFKLQRQGWDVVQYPQPIVGIPALFTSVMTFNGTDPVITRTKEVTAQGFKITMDEEETRRGGGHVREALGWITMKYGTGTTDDGRTILVDKTTTTHQPTVMSFPFTPTRKFPWLVADVISTSGSDPIFLRFQKLLSSSVELYVQEEQSYDAEKVHNVEDISVLVAE